MNKVEDARKEATRKLSQILEIQREFDLTYVGWPSTRDIYDYQVMMSRVIEVSEFLGDKKNEDLKRCKKVLSIIKRLHNLFKDKKYVLYQEIMDLIDIYRENMKDVIGKLVAGCTRKLKENI